MVGYMPRVQGSLRRLVWSVDTFLCSMVIALMSSSMFSDSPRCPGDPGTPGGPCKPRAPGGPITPCLPRGPTGPEGPSGPMTPSGPGKPLSPCGPSIPGAPDGPVSPLGPLGPFGPVAPAGPFSPISPVDQEYPVLEMPPLQLDGRGTLCCCQFGKEPPCSNRGRGQKGAAPSLSCLPPSLQSYSTLLTSHCHCHCQL